MYCYFIHLEFFITDKLKQTYVYFLVNYYSAVFANNFIYFSKLLSDTKNKVYLLLKLRINLYSDISGLEKIILCGFTLLIIYILLKMFRCIKYPKIKNKCKLTQ